LHLRGELRGEIFRRHEANPILTAAQWPRTVNAVFNPAVAQFEGETLLLARVETRTGISHLSVARSADGLTSWVIDHDRDMLPDLSSHAEEFGIEDPRITRVGDEYLIVYTGYSGDGPLVCLASTSDFRSYRRRGVLMPPEDKDAALFPHQFDGRWALIHRPVSATPRLAAHIWLSWSPDLRHWGDHTILLRAREGAWWDAHKVGLCAPPLQTPEGWLLLYHGVRTTAAGSIYRLGLALLDSQHPDRLLARSSEWLFGPDAAYERTGDVDQVVFSCGWQLLDDQDTLRIYYGAADTSICLATTSLKALLDWLSRHTT
jgi:predicted GH43/DUF377 family glycosyl hydrolase